MPGRPTDRAVDIGFGPRSRPDEVVPGFFEAQRRAHRRSLLLLIAIGVLLTLVVNLLLVPVHTREVCSADGRCEQVYDAKIGLYLLSIAGVVVYLLIAPRLALWLAERSQDEVTGQSVRQLEHVVEEMAIAAGVPVPRAMMLDDPALNAFAIPSGKSGAVAVTSGAVARLNRRELGGVVAHEIGHLGNRDSQVVMVATVTVAFIDHVRHAAVAIGRASGAAARPGRGMVSWIIALFAVAIAIVSWFVAIVLTAVALPAALMLRGGLSRERERLADAAGVQYTRDPGALRRALEKLADSDVPLRHDSVVSHSLWIDSPSRFAPDDWFQRLYDSHPPIEDRIRWLRALEGASGVNVEDC